MPNAAQTAVSGLALIDQGVKKLRQAGLGELADSIEQVVADAVHAAEAAHRA
jgi:hypothetical protein